MSSVFQFVQRGLAKPLCVLLCYPIVPLREYGGHFIHKVFDIRISTDERQAESAGDGLSIVPFYCQSDCTAL